MVTYTEAAEIPAVVIMEWIDGADLGKARATGLLNDWDRILYVAQQITTIVRRGHLLPERVLHRDIRPSNVMIKDAFDQSAPMEVVVMDFDLSWHKGSQEQSIVPTAIGYMAPEKLENRDSARSAAVDSFGTGMTLYFMLAGQHPLPAQQRHQDWTSAVKRAVQSKPSPSWQSIPRRVERLILAATMDKQSSRWDMADIENELTRLHDACISPDEVVAADLIAEELASRATYFGDYKWDPDRNEAVFELPTGAAAVVAGDDSANRIHIRLRWDSTGVYQNRDHKGVRKWIPGAADRAASALKSRKWQVSNPVIKRDTLVLDASESLKAVRTDFKRKADGIVEALRCLRLE